MTTQPPPKGALPLVDPLPPPASVRYVLDASALLAYLNDEPGAHEVQRCIEQAPAMMSSVNLAEVLSKCADQGMSTEDQAALSAALPLDIHPFDGAQALACAALRTPTRVAGLSLGDRCCLALAQTQGAVALTADQAWSRLVLPGARVQQIRPTST